MIINYLLDMSFFIVIFIPLIILYRIIWIWKRGFNKSDLWHEFGVLAFLFFMVGLFSQTIVPQIYINGSGRLAIDSSGYSAVNLIPFEVIKNTYFAISQLNLWQPFFINFLGNIIMFMPIGFMLPLLWSKFDRWYMAFLSGFFTSLFIELVQLSQSRSSDIDDILLNTTGAILGFLLYKIISKRIAKRFKRSLAKPI